ncbi:MAG: BolA/IbaG family iron-sulfur metabolism protein [Caldilineaceae bacterium]
MIPYIEAAIRQSIPDARVRVVDPYNDGQHFEAYVVSDAFEGLPLVRQHQLVLKSLKDEFDANTVHLVALKTFTPAKWEQAQSRPAFDL